MHICVLNGSPKGEYSVTLQTVLFLQKLFPADRFEIIHAAAGIRALEKDLTPVTDAVSRADLILFSYPVYTFLAPSQLHRLIELLKAAKIDLNSKYAAQITTSKHFYDVTANEWLRLNCLDMGLAYAGCLTADMEDLPTEKGQQEAKAFWDLVHYRIGCGLCDKPGLPAAGVADVIHEQTVIPGAPIAVSDDSEVVIVADIGEADHALQERVEVFRSHLPCRSRIVNIADFPFLSGCIGCMRCAASGECVFQDGFEKLLREKIQTADAIVYAFTVRDHCMGARMKCYDDRQFCNGHRTVTAGKPIAYIAAGSMARETNLHMVLEGRANAGGNFLCGIGTDGESIRRTADLLTYALRHHLTQPSNFLGVGGMKIFRDLIWQMQGFMSADHRFYKAHGMYDFPQKKKGTILLMKLAGPLLNNPKLRKKMGHKFDEGMLMPYRKVLDSLPDPAKDTQ